MTSIERTAYPRLTAYLSVQEMETIYTPTADELAFVMTLRSRDASRLTRLVLLKIHQCLGYFPPLETVPDRLLAFLRDQLQLPSSTTPSLAENTRHRHQQSIRDFLKVKPYNDGGERVVQTAMTQAAQHRRRWLKGKW